MSGFEVSERVKGSPRTAHLPIIQISAAAMSPDEHAEGLRRGADASLDRRTAAGTRSPPAAARRRPCP
ncbi:hypothetical protein ACIQVL_30680, partial [Streptomyces sp. NPDC090499]|uniref:hypothetical protein n=1 Tax=Streptomyces sp. NPDC090499 TaxID=3365965 RepID=UPI003811EF46